MNFKNILQEIEKTDPEVYERLSTRRNVLRSFGSKVAVAALPFAVGSLFKKAYGKTTDAVVDALNFALELEYFEFAFYHTANNTGNLIPATDLPGFQTIEAHEKAHINFLINTITTMGGVAFTPNHYTDGSSTPPFIPAAYDFTDGNKYQTFKDYDSFLIQAEAFEDTGIRAYLGQMSALSGNAVMEQAQQIAATEGRHAAHVRLVRRLRGAADVPAPWISNNVGPSSDFQANYLGEDNVTQTVDSTSVVITGLADGTGTVPQVSATAAFDEPLDKATTLSLLSPFILP
jgi:Ferritin-like domain